MGTMNRRTALKTFALTGAAALLIPGCTRDSKKVSVALTSLKVTPEDEELLASLAETIIPATDKPGAKEVGAHLFTLVMVDDCLPPDKKDDFMKGLRSFNQGAPVPGGRKFMEATAEDRQAALEEIEKDSSSLDKSVKGFYSTAKGYIIRGYTSSQYFMTEVKPYKLVPGSSYKGCVPLPTTQS
jgi:hypothetical protein